MSTLEESLNDQDPDYVSATTTAQQKIYEENARNNTAKKITAIIEKEFSREIDQKQKEILQIQEKLNKSLRTLHFLRYVIITDFYNRKQCELPQAAEASKQTRIHPAVQTLLGKAPKFSNCTEPAVPSTSTDPRFLPIHELPASEAKGPTIKEEDANRCNGQLPVAEKRKLCAADEESRPRKVPRYIPPKSSMPENNTRPSRGDRHKVFKRIIVGNISKWIPPDWRDGGDASHKWTMYVRGDKDDADISTYVCKVRFFLHPSYCPHDVVEVTSYPFHLSRRGWGEFPLRVQLHFRNALNKPIDIIHHLKLDRTFTGLQTLGSETLVNMWIHTVDSRVRDVDNSDVVSKNKSAESLAKDTRVKEEPSNEGDSYEPVSAMSSTLRLAEEVWKEEYINPEEIYNLELFDQPAESALAEKFTGVKTEAAVSTDEIRDVISSVSSTVSTDETCLEETRFNIEHDHNYMSEQYYKPRRVVRDGNVTIRHFSDNEAATAMDSSATEAVEQKPDGSTATSHRYNGDIQSSSDRQPPTVAHLASDDEAPSAISENIASKDATTTTTNGFCKPSGTVLDRLRDLQRTAAVNNSHLKPLEISIPPSFAPSASKRVLLVKDKKLIPVDVARKTLADGDAKVPTASSSSGTVPQGVSILKKPSMCSVKGNTKNAVANKEAAVFTLKGANSLLLNVNYAEPALKIADSHDPQYNYSLSDAMKGRVSSSSSSSSSSLIGNREGAKLADKEEKTTQRTKITLGKDRHKLQSKEELYEAVLRSIDDANIADTEALVRFIVRRLPIVTRDARDPEYRRLHPYACHSEKDFLALSIGKQRALEWHRAKVVKNYLRKKLSQDDRLWSVKEILMWARLHGYTPIRSVSGMSELDATNSSTKRLPDSSASSAPVSTYTEPVALHKWLQTYRQESSHHRLKNDCVEEIDVEVVNEDPCGDPIDRRKDKGGPGNSTVASSALPTPLELDEKLMPLHRFVCNTAQEIGIKIAPEEIVPGVVYCAASRAIMRVIECFVEDLTRSSLARAWERNGGHGCPKIITPDDVRSALASREEFDVFTNEGLGSQQQSSTTN